MYPVEPSGLTAPSPRRVPAARRPGYTADLTGGSLKLAESRVIADLLLNRVSSEAWKDAIYTRNVLKARRPATAQRLGNLIRSRLETMGPELWKLVRDGNGTVAAHAALAAAVKHSCLLGDFLRFVVQDHFRLSREALSHRAWEQYLEGCHERDPHMPNWGEATARRLRSSVFQTLAQAGFIADTKSLRLQTVHIADDVLRYLAAEHEDYVLRCIQVSA